jgi:NADH-quinone oxidoreductase subunit N
MGLILLAFSLGTFEGVKMVFYFFIVYTLSGLSVWSIFLMLKLKNSTEKYNKELGDFTLLNESHPVLAYAFVLTVFTLAGIPPMAGF